LAVLPVAPQLDVLEVPRWGYVHYLFPGILTFSVMLSGLFAMGYTMVLYRQNRFLKKLATTPLPKTAFVAAQIAARGSLILLQAAILVAIAKLVFALPLSFSALAWLVLITLLGLLTFMGAGFAIACLIRTEDLVVDIIGAINLPLVLLSEIFFPLDALPRPLAVVGGMLPSTEMVRLTREVLLYGGGGAALAPGLGVLALWTVATFALSLSVFRWHD
jgi:ABC-2 type transport system permease protein